MTELQNIKDLVSSGKLDEASALLADFIAANPKNDEALYLRGKLAWKRGDKRAAITDFNAAVAINPDSPARLSLSQATEIMNFYNTDLYNP